MAQKVLLFYLFDPFLPEKLFIMVFFGGGGLVNVSRSFIAYNFIKSEKSTIINNQFLMNLANSHIITNSYHSKFIGKSFLWSKFYLLFLNNTLNMLAVYNIIAMYYSY